MDSSEASVKQAGNTCQNGAINGICIGELDDSVLGRQLLGMLGVPCNAAWELLPGGEHGACSLPDKFSCASRAEQGLLRPA